MKNQPLNPVNLVATKLRNVGGDTLVEALSALLIAALGATLLATMIMVSVNVSASSQVALSNLYQEEKSLAPVQSAKDTLKIKKGSDFEVDVGIRVYRSANGEFLRYEPLNSPEEGQ